MKTPTGRATTRFQAHLGEYGARHCAVTAVFTPFPHNLLTPNIGFPRSFGWTRVGRGSIFADPIQSNLDIHNFYPILSINIWCRPI